MRKIFCSIFFFYIICSIYSACFAGFWTSQYQITGATVGGIYFTSSTEGYFANGTLWKTSRRGTTWESITLGTDSYLPAGVSYINNTLYTAGTKSGATGVIESSTNGGSTWTPVTPGGWLYYNIWFADSNNGVVAGGLITADFQHTTNGGTTWNAIDKGLGGETEKAHSSSTSNLYVVGKTGGYAKWDGLLWTASTVTGATSVYGVHVEDQNIIFACGEDATNGCIFKTTNGGTSWTKVVLAISATVKDIWFVSTLEGWVVTNSGLIYHTTNGGGSTADWIVQDSGTSSNFLSVFFTDPNNGWALAVDGIYKYIVSPEVTSVSPSSGAAGDSLNITIAGANLQGTALSLIDMPVISLGSGITVNIVSFESAAQITANITIAASAAVGARSITITNPDAGAVTSASAFTVTSGSSTTTTTTSTTSTSNTTTTTIPLISTSAPQYPAGKQYWNPDSDSVLPMHFHAENASANATITMIQIGPPYSTFRRSISVTAGDNKTNISTTSDLGGSYPNGIYKVYIFDNATGARISKGLITIYR